MTFSCNECGKSFTRKHYVTVHVRTVHEKRRDYQCYKCGKAFGEASLLRRHCQAVHDDERCFECNECGAVFRTAAYRDNHINAVHKKEPSFACDKCQKVFRWKGDVSRHKKSEHGEMKQIRCKSCHACYFEKGPLAKDICSARTVTSVTPDSTNFCKLCGIHFQHQHLAEKHEAEIHNRLFICDRALCTESFNDRVNLLLHAQLNHPCPPKAKKPFSCQLCSKDYDLKRSLARHLKQSHTDS